jgi:tRNA(fMet)-specific endonuclease VapC
VDNFLTGIGILPIFHSIDFYAVEKARLRKSGNPVDDFDLLIGSTAVTHSLIMVTNNVKEFSKIHRIQIENWTD